ncbi:MAG: hypothetical protein PHS16_02745 [Candidatus Colwellbacteria bacterium]|nr:hypothetical protein [Candidatus Colwellbacteria bacterium]
MNIYFKYDLEKDILNHRIIAEASFKGGPSRIQGFFKQKYGDDFTDKNIHQFIKGLLFSYYKIDDPNEVAIKFQKMWNNVHSEFTKKAKKIFGITLEGDIIVYLTTNDRSGLSIKDNFFFVNIGKKSPLLTAMHELIHFYTYYKSKDRAKELDLSDKEYYDIKESLTEMLNLEFEDLLVGAKDGGYKGHENLRELVKQEWNQSKDIEKVFKRLAKVIRG